MSTIFVVTQMKRFIGRNPPPGPDPIGWRPLRLVKKLDQAEKFDTQAEARAFAESNELRDFGILALNYAKEGAA